jgi:MOSC domain-containing protein YiiM
MAKILAVCISDKKGVSKSPVRSVLLKQGFGIVDDAHAGDNKIREISLLSIDSINRINVSGFSFKPGDFAENLTTSGIDLVVLPVGTLLQLGNEVVIQITQIGKQCHSGCAIFKEVGKCIMPKEGVFAKVIKDGVVEAGDIIEIISSN